jgi:cyclophilin family peptidyl-prolyl cis-trans isomerase
MFFKRLSRHFLGKGKRRGITRSKQFHRRVCFEPLESRQLLSITFPQIQAQSVLAGAPLNLVLNATETSGNALSYTVSVSNLNLSNAGVQNPQLSATIPQGNPSLRITVNDAADGINGDMVFQLFEDLTPKTVDRIMSLVGSNFYDGLLFHRVIDSFMIQGGSGGTATQFDDEFNAALQFTSPGLLAMANSGSDTNTSQFFITTAQTRWLDFNHTIVGIITEGSDILNQIENVPTDSNDKPVHDVVITDATIITDNHNGVLRLSAPVGTTGTADVTVTVTDSVSGETIPHTFQVTVGADTNDNQPFLGNINPIQTNANTAVSFDIPATDVEGNAIYYAGMVSPTNTNITLNVNSSTGHATLTPANNVYGVFSLFVGASMPDPPSSDTAPFDTQYVPLYINPAAPSGILLQSASDTGGSQADNLTKLNNSAGNTLQFTVNGVISGAYVELFADGVLIGHATATDTSVTITTDGAAILTDGTHAITAKQSLLNQAVNVNNLHTTTNLVSTLSTSLTITVETTTPQFNFTPVTTAVIGNVYTCTVTTNADSAGGMKYQLTQKPASMLIGETTGVITWTPAQGQSSPAQVTVLATDLAGNTAQQSFSINVLPANTAPILSSASPLMGATNENTAVTVNLTGTFINHGAGSTTITDTDQNAVTGGIAIIDLSGKGTWEFTTDGVTFIQVGAVSPASALLLAHNAALRYTPDGKNGEVPIISYRAWDTTSGTNGGRADLSQTSALGGTTAFSVGSDIATLTVNDVNDAPVLTQANPLLGRITPGATKTINLTGTFINNGTNTTAISDVDETDTKGGIALIGMTGNGVWEYSTNGTAFTALGTVGPASALLLDTNAVLRYTPNGTSSETATITYQAWDQTSGATGNRVDLSLTNSTGGTTAFSVATDTASIEVGTGSIAGFVYVDTDNDGNRIIPASGKSHLALAGVVVQLYVKNDEGSWVEVNGKSPVLTGTDGSYKFEGLSPGTYRIAETQPAYFLDGKETAGRVDGVLKGTAGQDQIEIQLGPGENGTEYNFGERGLLTGKVSKRLSLGSTPAPAQIITQMNKTPTVDLATLSTGDGYTASYTGSMPVAIVPSSAKISDADSSMLASMTISIANAIDGASEKLEASVANTPFKASYIDNVLMLTGVASTSVYEDVLKTVKYSNSASHFTTVDREIDIIVSDGIASSLLTTVKVQMVFIQLGIDGENDNP